MFPDEAPGEIGLKTGDRIELLAKSEEVLVKVMEFGPGHITTHELKVELDRFFDIGKGKSWSQIYTLFG